jgi:hypothetical protein
MPETLIRVRRVYLDAGGYSRADGKYYGRGAPVYEWDAEVPYQHWNTGAWETRIVDGSLRAGDIAAARRAVLKLYPGARFTR